MVAVDCSSCESKGCCTYLGWKVFFLNEEREAVASVYGEPYASQIEEFYGRKNGKPVYAASLPCPFFEVGSGRCKIYDARPLVCRLFPVEIEPITGTYYRDQSVCPEREKAAIRPELVQIEVKTWCERFWQISPED